MPAKRPEGHAMNEDKPTSPEGAGLRRRAEKKLRDAAAGKDQPQTEADAQRLLHELQVHQVEVTTQIEDLDGIFNFVPAMICVASTDGYFKKLNLAWQRTLGFTNPELLAKPYAEFIHPDDLAPTLAELEKLVRGQAAVEFTNRILCRDGTYKWLEWDASPSPDGASFFAVARDVTGRARVDAELRASREQLRQLTRHVEAARESERASIAREIHDELGQGLTALKLDVAWLGRHLAGEVEPLQQRIAVMSDQIDATLQTVRHIAAQLRPWLLDELGLAAALEWQAREFEQRTEIECDLQVDQALECDREVSTAFFRIFQEALTNVARHAHAKRVTARLEANPDEWVLTVSDDGVGFPEETLSSSKALGLVGMRERVSPWGGAVHITSQPGHGTTVTARVRRELPNGLQTSLEARA